ncbi:MAG: FecR domain-containing protein [bacterium]
MFDYMKVVRVVSVFAALPMFAQEAQPVAKPAEATPAVTAPAVADQSALSQAVPATKPKGKIFDIMSRAMTPRGIAEINNPDVGSFQPIYSNKAYPLGSSFRTGSDSSVVINFSATDGVQLMEDTEVVIVADEKNPDARMLKLIRGRLLTFMKDNMPEEMFSVSTPNAICKSLAGRAEIELSFKDGNEELQVATITGTLVIEGLQFTIPALRAANTVNILTATNRSLSRMMSEKGDFKIVLSNGTDNPVSYDMSPHAVVKIWRENAPVGGRTIVSTLVVGPSGTARHRFVYAIGRAILSTGELVDQTILEQQEKTLRTLGGTLAGQPPTNGQRQQTPPPAEEKKPADQTPPAETK